MPRFEIIAAVLAPIMGTRPFNEALIVFNRPALAKSMVLKTIARSIFSLRRFIAAILVASWLREWGLFLYLSLHLYS